MKFCYRYTDQLDHYSGNVYIHLEHFKVVKETPHTYLIVPCDLNGNEDGFLTPKPRRVVKNARVSWAYADKARALNSFKIRKRKQLGYIRESLHRVTTALAYVADAPEDILNETTISCGRVLLSTDTPFTL